jgi:hypothetical protein
MILPVNSLKLKWWFNNCEIINSSQNVLCRVDRDGKCYTGVLCGLGWSSTTEAPILPEHDIELAFDVQFNVEDIVEVSVTYSSRSNGDLTLIWRLHPCNVVSTTAHDVETCLLSSPRYLSFLMPSILPCRMSTPFWLFAAFVL